MANRPERHGFPWEQWEADLVYLTEKTIDNHTILATTLERNETAVDFAWRWSDPNAGFPPEAYNSIMRLLQDEFPELWPRFDLEEDVKGVFWTPGDEFDSLPNELAHWSQARLYFR